MRFQDYEYVFIVTYGRSGSTLLMNMLNSIDGYNIRGENLNALYWLFQAAHSVQRAKRKFGGDLYRPSWEGIRDVDPEAFSAACADAFVSHVLQPRDGDRVLGFKEIRYIQRLNALGKYLDFIEQEFRCVRFVFNIRDPAAVSRSGWWKRTDGAAGMISRFNKVLTQESHARAERGHLVRYEDYSRDPDALEPLFDFLGEKFDRDAIRTVLSARKYS